MVTNQIWPVPHQHLRTDTTELIKKVFNSIDDRMICRYDCEHDHSTLGYTEETITSWNIQVSASLLYIVVTMRLVAICLAHLLFLLGMKGRWSAANVPQLCSTILLSPLSLSPYGDQKQLGC